MSTTSGTSPGWHGAILLLGRILIGGIFVQSGFDKLMGLDAFATGLAARGLPAALARRGGKGPDRDLGSLGAPVIPRSCRRAA